MISIRKPPVSARHMVITKAASQGFAMGIMQKYGAGPSRYPGYLSLIHREYFAGGSWPGPTIYRIFINLRLQVQAAAAARMTAVALREAGLERSSRVERVIREYAGSPALTERTRPPALASHLSGQRSFVQSSLRPLFLQGFMTDVRTREGVRERQISDATHDGLAGLGTVLPPISSKASFLQGDHAWRAGPLKREATDVWRSGVDGLYRVSKAFAFREDAVAKQRQAGYREHYLLRRGLAVHPKDTSFAHTFSSKERLARNLDVAFSSWHTTALRHLPWLDKVNRQHGQLNLRGRLQLFTNEYLRWLAYRRLERAVPFIARSVPGAVSSQFSKMDVPPDFLKFSPASSRHLLLPGAQAQFVWRRLLPEPAFSQVPMLANRERSFPWKNASGAIIASGPRSTGGQGFVDTDEAKRASSNSFAVKRLRLLNDVREIPALSWFNWLLFTRFIPVSSIIYASNRSGRLPARRSDEREVSFADGWHLYAAGKSRNRVAALSRSLRFEFSRGFWSRERNWVFLKNSDPSSPPTIGPGSNGREALLDAVNREGNSLLSQSILPSFVSTLVQSLGMGRLYVYGSEPKESRQRLLPLSLIAHRAVRIAFHETASLNEKSRRLFPHAAIDFVQRHPAFWGYQSKGIRFPKSQSEGARPASNTAAGTGKMFGRAVFSRHGSGRTAEETMFTGAVSAGTVFVAAGGRGLVAPAGIAAARRGKARETARVEASRTTVASATAGRTSILQTIAARTAVIGTATVRTRAGATAAGGNVITVSGAYGYFRIDLEYAGRGHTWKAATLGDAKARQRTGPMQRGTPWTKLWTTSWTDPWKWPEGQLKQWVEQQLVLVRLAGYRPISSSLSRSGQGVDRPRKTRQLVRRKEEAPFSKPLGNRKPETKQDSLGSSVLPVHVDMANILPPTLREAGKVRRAEGIGRVQRPLYPVPDFREDRQNTSSIQAVSNRNRTRQSWPLPLSGLRQEGDSGNRKAFLRLFQRDGREDTDLLPVIGRFYENRKIMSRPQYALATLESYQKAKMEFRTLRPAFIKRNFVARRWPIINIAVEPLNRRHAGGHEKKSDRNIGGGKSLGAGRKSLVQMQMESWAQHRLPQKQQKQFFPESVKMSLAGAASPLQETWNREAKQAIHYRSATRITQTGLEAEKPLRLRISQWFVPEQNRNEIPEAKRHTLMSFGRRMGDSFPLLSIEVSQPVGHLQTIERLQSIGRLPSEESMPLVNRKPLAAASLSYRNLFPAFMANRNAMVKPLGQTSPLPNPSPLLRNKQREASQTAEPASALLQQATSPFHLHHKFAAEMRDRAGGEGRFERQASPAMEYLKRAPGPKNEGASSEAAPQKRQTETEVERTISGSGILSQPEMDRLVDKMMKELEKRLSFERQRRGL
ncbi:hypothetical protein [Brevibacillus borstelensis]|uniref:hypothetical protein n=1 Tax=Brevibacillus borstelensis TaxID=45462 RepID=UPI0030BFC8FA